MAITTYIKLPGSILTPEEASEAQTTFIDGGGLPSDDYTFEHWSSSESSDVPVTGLEPDGAGVVVNSNLNYYPVVNLKSPAIFTASGGNVQYVTAAESLVAAESGVITWEGQHTTGAPTQLNSIYLDIAIAQSNIPNNSNGTVQINSQAANVRFGLINVPVNYYGASDPNQVTYSAFSQVSEVDGQTYYIQIASQTIYVQGQYFPQAKIQVYKESGSTKIDITANCEGLINLVDNLIAGQVYTAAASTLNPGSNTAVNFVNGEIQVTRTSGSGYVSVTSPQLLTKGNGYIFTVSISGIRSLDSPVTDDGNFTVSESTSAQEVITDPLTTSPQTLSGDWASRNGLDSAYYINIASANEFAFTSLIIMMLPDNQAE